MSECSGCGLDFADPRDAADHERSHADVDEPLEQLMRATTPADPRLVLVVRWLSLRCGGTPDGMGELLGLDPADCSAAAEGRPHRLSVTHQLRLCSLTLTYAAAAGRHVRWTPTLPSAMPDREARDPEPRGVRYVIGSGAQRAEVSA